MPTSPLKRTSGGGGGRLRRLLASLRPPARAGPLPVQTGFPTSLADIVVKNHGRLRNPRRRHRAALAPAATTEPAPVSPQTRERSVAAAAHDAPAPPVPVPARPGKGVVDFSIRPGILAAAGAVVLVLLVIWSKQLVATATLVSVALSWIENVRTVRPRRPETETEEELRSPRGRWRVSPIRDAVEAPRPSCGSDDGGSDAADADSGGDLGRDDSSSSPVMNPKLKQRRRSVRKLLASKLRNGKTLRGTDSRHGEHPSAGEANAEPAAAAAAAVVALAPAQEAITDDDRWHRRGGSTLLLPALVPIILAGLVAGKLPALVLAVLCAAFSSPVDRVPAAGRAGGQQVR